MSTQAAGPTHQDLIFVGCYTGDNGTGEGITLLARDPDSGALTRRGLVARTPSPSFLAAHGALPVLYAVNEELDGAVSAFAVAADGALTPLAVRATGGAHPCHVAVTSDRGHLLVANYSGGSVAVFPLDAAGVPGERSDLLVLTGDGPVADRQEGPHAHMVAPEVEPTEVLAVDLGTDRVVRLRIDPATGRLTLVATAVRAVPGTGPRHLVRSADGALLLVGELAGNLTWYRRTEPAEDRAAPGDQAEPQGEWQAQGVVPLSLADGLVQPSEIGWNGDGRFVYVAIRGRDTVAAFGWDGSAATPVAEVSTGGQWPRHLAVIGDHLYVANERSHGVSTFRIDPVTGVPVPQGESLALPSPTCLLRWTS